MRVTSTLLASAFVVCGLRAQSYTAYPIDDLHGVYGHWAPLGILATATNQADECRVHFLIPAPFLASGPSVITGIEMSPHVGGNVPYERLIIRCGLTTAPTLSTIFANNATSFTTVFSQTGFSSNWASRTTWYPITFTTPFISDGVSNLVIEFEKVIDRPNNPTLPTISHQFNAAPMRKDLPYPVFREGIYGSGAATAATGLVHPVPPLIRLRWVTDPALTIRSTRASGRGYYHLGSMITLNVQAMANEVFVVFLDGALATTPLSVPGVNGFYWLPPRFIVLGIGAIPSSGVGTLSVPVPNDPGLVAALLYFEGAVVGSRLAWTNAVDAVISQ
jgi:hypothetical protein